jgi:hypothetical protein
LWIEIDKAQLPFRREITMTFVQRTLILGLAGLAAGSLAAQTLHFKVTGDYQAQTIIAYQEDGGQATVKDRVIIEFDKDIKSGKVGPVSIQNFPSESKDFRNVEKKCPPPTPKGNYEHIEVTSVTYDGYGAFLLKGTRSFPEVQVTAYCQGSWAKKTVPTKRTPAETYVAMIEGNEPTVFNIKLDDGWTWNYVTTRGSK